MFRNTACWTVDWLFAFSQPTTYPSRESRSEDLTHRSGTFSIAEQAPHGIPVVFSLHIPASVLRLPGSTCDIGGKIKRQ